MLAIADTLISDEIISARFVCNVEVCKAACCVEGDMGAPLEASETAKLDEIFPLLTPYLTDAGKLAIAEQGKWVVDADGDLSTPTINGRECAYALYDAKGILQCGIEKAWEDGVVDFRKPISCHLYPVRVKQHNGFRAVNYHQWNICDPACSLGQQLGVPVFRFLKDALISKFGSEWYEELEVLAAYQQSKNDSI
jgi:hypothetical protein